MRSPAFLAALLIISASLSLANAELFRPSGGGKAAGNLMVETIATGLSHPWASPSCPTAACWSPSGLAACASSAGTARCRRRSPACRSAREKQGGLLDVVLDRDFAKNRTIYFCFTEPVSGGGRTALARARLVDGETPRLEDVQVIFRRRGRHRAASISAAASSRRRDGNLFLTTGDHTATARRRRTSATISAR